MPNRAQGVLVHARHLTCAHVSITIAAGYLDEPTALPGLAHLLEHVLTTAPLKASSSTSLITWFSQHQGSLNAHTDDYVTDVHFSIPAETLEAAALTIASQLATPTFSLPTIRAEVAAIDAEWQARQHSSTLQRLSAIATLSDPQHIGAGCRHGNATTLGHNMARLHRALTTFHSGHYHGGRVSIAIISPWPTDAMSCLIKRMATRFSPPSYNAPSLAITSRWGSLLRAKVVKVVATDNTLELLWPLPSAISPGQLTHLVDIADSLNQGYLEEPLPDSITDYHATLAPGGATDTFSLTLSGSATKEQLETFAVALSKRLASRHATPSDPHSIWQPPADTVQLAPAWFAYARQRASARRLTANTIRKPPPSHHTHWQLPRWLEYDAPAPPRRTAAIVHSAPSAHIQHWCGQYDVSDDFAALANTTWVACFVPNAIILSASLAAKRLARQGVLCQQKQLPQGSWIMALGKKAAAAMQTLLREANVTPMTAPQGLLAQQLVQRLSPFPSTPAVWVSHATDKDAVCHALKGLVSRIGPPSSQALSTNMPTSTAIMRTLSLPGTPSQRWLLALAEQHHSATFFQQARYEHQLGYVAAVRRGDGAPCSLGYVVQTSEAAGPIEETLLSISDALWQGSDSTLQTQLPTLTPPETPLAALIIQWQSLLAGTDQPLHRLLQQRITPQTMTDLLTQIHTLGRWQTHWLDSNGHYDVSD
ncbi:insulinase family protein [Vreelandella aquamarina]